jgi:hypothetical protein
METTEGYLRITLFGSVQHENVKTLFQQISDIDESISCRRLWDLRNCTLDLTSAELIGLATVAKELGLPDGRGAVLADKDVNFGLSRLYRAYRESDNATVRVYRNEAEAIEWVTEGLNNTGEREQ